MDDIYYDKTQNFFRLTSDLADARRSLQTVRDEFMTVKYWNQDVINALNRAVDHLDNAQESVRVAGEEIAKRNQWGW